MNGLFPKRQARRGHTLLEMMLSLVLLSIVMASVTSAMLFAASANPDEDSPEVTIADDSRVLSRIAEDLSLARYVIEQTDKAVTFVVGDRTGDGTPDRIRYAWSGTYGDPLTYQLNDETPTTLLENTAQFGLTYTSETVISTLPGTLERGDTEQLIASQNSILLHTGYFMNDTMAIGQRYTPALDAGVVAYEPSRLRLYAKRAGNSTGVIPVAIKDVQGDTPQGDAHVSATLYERGFGTYPNWGEVSFSSSVWLSASEEKIISIGPGTGIGNILVPRYHNTAGTPFSYSSDSGVTWLAGYGGSMLFELYAYPVTYGKALDISRSHLTQARITLQSVASSGRSPLKRMVRMMLAPATLESFAQTEFDADPTLADLDNNKAADWSHSTGKFPETSISDGVWTADGSLIFEPAGLSSAKVITVKARMRSNDTLGPTIYGPYTIDSGGDGLAIITQLRDDKEGGQELLIFNGYTATDPVLTIPDLPSGLVDVGLTVIPDEDYLCIAINHEPVATLKLDRVTDNGAWRQAIWLTSGGGVAEFESVYIKVGGSYEISASDTDGGGLITNLLNLLK